MRPETQRLIRMIVPAKINGGTPPTSEEKQTQRKTIYGKHGVLDVLNTKLGSTGAFVCGQTMTVVDVVLYCEIATILALTLKSEDELSQNNQLIYKWVLRMKAVEGMAPLDAELQAIIEKYDLAEK